MSVFRPTVRIIPGSDASDGGPVPMLTPCTAWRVWQRRTHTRVAKATFYRWLEQGRLPSLKAVGRIYIPWPWMDEALKAWRSGWWEPTTQATKIRRVLVRPSAAAELLDTFDD